TDWRRMMGDKLGIADLDGERDSELIHDLLELLPKLETDMTLFFRGLANVSTDDGLDDDARVAPLLGAYYDPDAFNGDVRAETDAWLDRYIARVRKEGRTDADRAEAMNAINPLFVLRNYLAQLAIDEADNGDPSLFLELLDTLRTPYTEQPGRERFAGKRPEWARVRPGCSMLSCSS
ncbi:MAG: hypothetical protein CL433_04530, partial [Acidimicrobiaceae bacterium]|nr:hypothetical protein [Acidimicrobiaceae bacterium]